ncbi:MAG: M24 family metallopeptidase [Bacillus sp. (in: firmicutes)]
MMRLTALRTILDENDIDGILITNGINRRYITGFTGSAGTVLVTKTAAHLLVDSRYITQASDQAKDFTVKEINRNLFYEEIVNIVKRMGVNKLGFEQKHISFYEYSQLCEYLPVELVPLSGVVEKMRTIKTEDEITLIKTAAEISDSAFAHILSVIRAGMTEIEIANELELHMRKLGATSSFDMIIASGLRSALPHGVASEKVIESGDIVTLDFGAYYKGYCSDMTRTIAVGEPSLQIKEIYSIVNRALENALNGIKAGIRGKEADALTRDVINEAGYGSFYGHGTGHGIGLYIHEDIFMSSTCEDLVEVGMVLTVEPGIYIPGVGGVRVEDDIIVRENGIETITKSSKELIII